MCKHPGLGYVCLSWLVQLEERLSLMLLRLPLSCTALPLHISPGLGQLVLPLTSLLDCSLGPYTAGQSLAGALRLRTAFQPAAPSLFTVPLLLQTRQRLWHWALVCRSMRTPQLQKDSPPTWQQVRCCPHRATAGHCCTRSHVGTSLPELTASPDLQTLRLCAVASPAAALCSRSPLRRQPVGGMLLVGYLLPFLPFAACNVKICMPE